jgi:hypothetical protein
MYPADLFSQKIKIPSNPDKEDFTSADKFIADYFLSSNNLSKDLSLKDILNIKEITFGEFPEISNLNPRFRADSQKVKVTLDIQIAETSGLPDFSSLTGKLIRLLPTLKKHQCGEHLFDDLKPNSKVPRSSHLSSDCSCQSDLLTDIAHLMEHVIIDLLSNITRMPSCSGITCGYKEPGNRFDMFVECRDKNVGWFSVNFAADIFRKLLESGNLPKSAHRLIDLVKYLYRNSSSRDQTELETTTELIARDLGLKSGEVSSLLQKLKEFGLFTPDRVKTGSPTLN